MPSVLPDRRAPRLPARSRRLRRLRTQRTSGSRARHGRKPSSRRCRRTPRLFTRARDEGADLVLVHHGLFWAGPPRPLDRAAKRRLQLLFDADIALAAYHLPLDGHLELGNNALLAQAIGCASSSPFAAHRRATIGVAGRLRRGRHRPSRPRRARARRDRPRAARLHRRPGRACAPSGSSPARAPTTSRTRSPPASTRSSPASRSSARWPARARPRSTSSPPATTRPRPSASGVSASCSRPSFGVRHVFVDVPNPI